MTRYLTEADVQAAFVAWRDLWAARPQYADLAWLAAIPNGEHRTKAVAGKLKAAGVKAGMPDLVWMRPGTDSDGTPSHWLALEFKGPTGRQSPEQRAFAAWATTVGGAYHVVRSAGVAALLVCQYAGWFGDIAADAESLAGVAGARRAMLGART